MSSVPFLRKLLQGNTTKTMDPGPRKRKNGFEHTTSREGGEQRVQTMNVRCLLQEPRSAGLSAEGNLASWV